MVSCTLHIRIRHWSYMWLALRLYKLIHRNSMSGLECRPCTWRNKCLQLQLTRNRNCHSSPFVNRNYIWYRHLTTLTYTKHSKTEDVDVWHREKSSKSYILNIHCNFSFHGSEKLKGTFGICLPAYKMWGGRVPAPSPPDDPRPCM